jgi:chromosome segregation ATPase
MAKRSWLWGVLCLAGAFAVDAAELYRWVDEQGRVQVSDRLPAGQTRYTTLNPKGIRIQDVAPQSSPTPQDRAAQQAHEQQAARLRQLYGSAAEIQTIRDQQLDDLQANLAFLQEQRARLVSQLAGLKAREAAFLEGGKTIPPTLRKQIQQSAGDLEAHERAIAQRQQDLEHTRAAYEADLEAYRALVESPATASGDLKDESASPPPRP